MKTLTNILIILTVSLNMVSCGANSDFLKVSEYIYKNRLDYDDKKISRKFHKTAQKIRYDLYIKGHINFFSTSEPLFMLNGTNIEEQVIYTTIWNSKGIINYINLGSQYNIKEEILFSADLLKLVGNWNLNQIKKNIKEKGVITHPLNITAKGIYFTKEGNVSEIKEFSFDEYSDLTDYQN